MYQLTLKDVDCGFKMIKREVLEKIPHLESSRGAMINAEIAIKTKKYGFSVGQIGVNHYPRLSGKPTGASLQVIFRSYMDLLRLWWKLKDQKILFLALLGILALASFLRLYRIDEYMLFLGDEGRDAIIVKNMIDEWHFPAIGPPTSVGNIYLGPLYYYMMFVPMVLTNFNPVSASVMVALIGVATVFLIYYLGKVWFGRSAALLAAYLYAISPVTINYANFSWNPNPTPFFALLSILGFYLSKKLSNYRWIILSGVAAAFAIQMHYLALILLLVLLTLWFNVFFVRKAGRNFWQGTMLAVFAFSLLMSPLVFFDLRHDLLNYRAITSFFLQSNTNVSLNLFAVLERIPQIYNHNLIGRYIAGENNFLTPLVSMIVLVPLLITGYLIYKKKEFNWGLWVLNNWLLIGVLGLTLYQHTIYDHYLGFLNPVPFLLFGSLTIIKFPGKFTNLRNILLIFLIVTLTYVNLSKNPLRNPPNNQLKRTQDVAKFIIEKSRGEDFNFALLSENNYDSAYQFYLEGYGAESKKLPFEKTDQLFVVCEDEICNPIYSPKHEIAAFGWTLVESTWDFEGVKIYKLIHNPEEQKQ